MASTVMLKASGLQTSPNELERQEGALIEAKNVIIKRDGIIEQRRGFNLYGTALPQISDRVKQLTTYRNRIIRHYNNKLQYDSDGSGTFLEFSGNIMETQEGLRMKFIESNGNFYFTTSDGIQKISAKSPNDFTSAEGYIKPAGAVKALDLTGTLLYSANSQSQWFPQDSAVAYRVLWGYKDANNNLVLGAPSQREVVSNPMLDLLLQDYMRLLNVLDSFENSPLTSARINDKNYISTLGVNLTSTATQLQSNLVALTTKIDNDILYANQASTAPLQMNSGAAVISTGTCTITFASGDPTQYLQPGSKIFLTGFAPATETLDGEQTVVTVTSTTITFNTTATGPVILSSATINSGEYRALTQPSVPSSPATNGQLVEMQNYISEIISLLAQEPTTVISTTDQALITELDVTTTATTQLSITIPQGIDSSYFFQVYRSSIAQATGAATFDDVVPSDELQLVYEAYPTNDEITSGIVVFEDITPDAFRGANLYTNASTGEGILQANDIPPFAKDINRYRNSVFYANTRTRHRLDLNLLGVTEMINDFDNGDIPKVTIASSSAKNTYEFILGLQQVVDVTTVADVANSLSGKYFLISSTSKDYYVWFNTGASGDPAIDERTGIEVKISTNASAVQVAQALYNKLSTYLFDFIVEIASNLVTIRNLESGYCQEAEHGNSGFIVDTIVSGTGEAVQPEITEIKPVAGNLYVSSGAADHFYIYSAFDQKAYYVWFKRASAVDPAVPGFIPIEIEITGTETKADVATLIAAAMPTDVFSCSVDGDNVFITNVQSGKCQAANEFVANHGFKAIRIQEGLLQVLLSPVTSPAQAVDETARSFVRVINKNMGGAVYAYYLSGNFDVPGKMNLEARELDASQQFYVVANNDNTGISFNPDIGPEIGIFNITAGASPEISTTGAHLLKTGDFVVMTATDSIPSVDGLYEVTVTSPSTFTIEGVYTIVGGSSGALIKATNAVFSENEEKINRVYYSKFSQPDAVPLLNFFDVGAADKAILRIVALRDSLFVFKEDGLYRISGENAPFQLELFDNSLIAIAPDSIAVCNNIIYAWTTQGIQSLSEGGSRIISRAIDNIILRIQSSNFINFKTATWGVGYESDNAYIVFTVSDEADEDATIAYRYSTLTNSWTTYDLTKLAGVVNPADDKLYLASSDVPYIEQERKTFSRLDYTDREFTNVISANKLLGNTIILPSVTNMSVGDVIVQDQTITMEEFNILLRKLDLDTGVSDSDYLSSLQLVAGGNPRVQLEALANRLDSDAGVNYTGFFSDISNKSGVITSISQADSTVITSVGHGLLTGRKVLIDSSDSIPSINGSHIVTVIDADTFSIPIRVTTAGTTGNFQTVNTDFEDLKTCYNKIVSVLNTDTGVSFNNYKQINNNTIMEAIITDINRITKKITLNLSLQFLVGEITVHQAFESAFTYSPSTLGDPLMLKHMREATMMFESRAFTGGTLSFSTDLLPEFQPVPFKMDGNGIFGHTPFGSGFFGGIGSAAPMRTYIPRQCQRCRYMVVRFSHKTAREEFRVTGMSLTGEIGQSTRAYR